MHNKVPPPEYYIDYIYELNGLSVVIDNDYFTLFNVAPYSQAERFRFTSSNIFSANNPSLRSSMVLREYVGEDITLLSSDRDALPDVYTIDVGNINSVSASFSEISFEGIIGPTNNLIIRNEVLPLIYQKQIQAVETTNNTSYKKVSLMPSNRNTLRVQNIATGTGILYEDPNMSYPEKWISQDWECTPKHPDKIRVKNKEIQIRSLRGNTVCFMIVLGQFSTSSQGVIQFAYKAEHGTNPKLLVTSEIEGGGLNIVYKEELLETEELIKKKITFPIAKNSRYRIFLFSENSLLTDKLLVFSDIAFGAIMPDLFSKIFVGANNVYQFNRSAASNEALVYKELNSTKYVISLINISRPGYIVSAMAYDKGWEISNNRTKNVLIDGYFNGWYIDPVELCGTKETLKEGCTINPDGSYNIDLVIEFTPQRWFYIGLIISGTTLLGCIGYLGYDFVRTRRLKKGEGVIG
jgi:hypothetical protein